MPRHQLYLPKVTDVTAREQKDLCSKVLFTVGSVKRASLKLTFRSNNRKTMMFLKGLNTIDAVLAMTRQFKHNKNPSTFKRQAPLETKRRL